MSHADETRDEGVTPAAGDPVRRRTAAAAAVLFVVLLGVYHLNGDFLYGNDPKPSLYQAAGLLKEGDLSFTPDEAPFAFTWLLGDPQADVRISFASWDADLDGRPARERRDAGDLTAPRPRYFLTPTRREGVYVSTFGPGPALAAVPVLGVLHLATGDVAAHPKALWYGGKFAAAALVAGSAVFVFLAVLPFTGLAWGLVIAAAYGLGTCVWSTSSQALWQHGPNEFFLALGTYLLLRPERSRWGTAWCGLAYGAAVACRPTSGVVVLAVGVYLLMRDRRALLHFVLGGLPIAFLLGAYNVHYFGSPLEFGQAAVGAAVAQFKTGSPDLWQTPLWKGAAGLLISPSRGLLVYSPFLVFALWGAWVAWRDRTYHALRPVTVGAMLLFLVAAKWFDWWGGWCYGYRPIVDTAPLLAVCMAPAVPLLRRRGAKAVFVVLLAWSVLVQVLGAFAYNTTGWNNRRAGRTHLNVDVPANRRRLWSVRDAQIPYYLTNFAEARQHKHALMAATLEHPER